MDAASISAPSAQITGVKVTTQQVGMSISAVGRSGRNAHHTQCLVHVSKWPIALVIDLVASSLLTVGYRSRSSHKLLID